MSFAGLRGGMAFSLVLMIDKNLFPEARMFKSTTLIIILFTVFVQGGTIKYWVKLFDIKKKTENEITILETNNKAWLRDLDKQYLKHYLIKANSYNRMDPEKQ